jgi:hypothetical protein
MTPGLDAFLDRKTPPISPDAPPAPDVPKPGLLAFVKDSSPASVLVIPAVYSVVLPFALLDLWTTAFQWIFFPMLGIPRVKRGDYVVIDRHHLPYLNAIEKIHCLYCSYANGLIAYVREIAARTEQYACPIKHSRPIAAPHARYHLFVDYGDAEGYREELEGLRRSIADKPRTRP